MISRDYIHQKKLLDSETDAMSISSISYDNNKMKTSISIEARFVRITASIDCSHPTTVDLPSTTSESIVVNTDSPNSYPYQTTSLSFRTFPPLFPTPTNILSESPCPTLKPSTAIPIPSLTITDQIITPHHHLNRSARTKDYSDSSPFDYGSPYHIPAILGTTDTIYEKREHNRFDRKSFVVLDDNVECDNGNIILINIDVPEKSDQTMITEDCAYGDMYNNYLHVNVNVK
ncbi:17587_t:CDS:2 [Dentiscutata erythropus]|uniref:17587_t:CDS:1 n=1 Tax=Dentiscutata erythropus TaxID=1348616 RepID=A0A9N9B5Z4_9GLOM|nr:17587_t:CDS:2 [Dentiscutata erythropus]